jgi:hypothetical protein
MTAARAFSAARIEKAGEVRAFTQLGDAQFHPAGSRLPVAVAIAVALIDPLGRALPARSAGERADLHLHQALGGEADHLAQKIGVRGLFQKRAKRHHLVGHRLVPRLR